MKCAKCKKVIKRAAVVANKKGFCSSKCVGEWAVDNVKHNNTN